MTRKEYLEAILEIAEDAPQPKEARTLEDHQKVMDDFDKRMTTIYKYTQTLLGTHPHYMVEDD